ncbi:hypothetical protein FGB62_213g015 [Gracilaria domingensis]|nr:hypothetical protein FGB62_213g015 [Gracilaria domingensis]
MRTGSVKSPTLPPLSPAAIPTPTGLSPLQDALRSVLQNSVVASEPCYVLINKRNCSRSLPEWKAAHDLLVLAVTDGHIDPEHPDGKLYFWKDQLYCTVTDLPIASHKDKLVVFNCFRQAKQMNLIDSADAYIQGILERLSENSEVYVLKKACITLFQRLTSLETTIDDLRAAFDAYSQQQLFCNVIAIALKLIPIAEGAVSNALEVAVELCGVISGADVIEYSLWKACAILEQRNFSKLPQTKQAQLVGLFQEYEFTREQVRCLVESRLRITHVPITEAALLSEASSPSDNDCESQSGLDSAPALIEDDPTDEVLPVRVIRTKLKLTPLKLILRGSARYRVLSKLRRAGYIAGRPRGGYSVRCRWWCQELSEDTDPSSPAASKLRPACSSVPHAESR